MTHFAKQGNFSDCAAKEGNQDRAVKLLGIVASGYFLPGIAAEDGGGENKAWAAYVVLTGLHLVFNVLAMRALRLDERKKIA